MNSISENKIAVIGLGNWGANILRVFSEILPSENVIAVDQNLQTVHATKKLFPEITFDNDLVSVISDPTVNAVAIATPSEFHFEIAAQSLKNNKHVFVEKPLATSLQHGKELSSLAKDNNLQIMVDHLMLYHPTITYLHKMVTNGELGELLYIACRRKNLGMYRQNESVLWDLGPHDISIILEIFQEYPNAVSASGSKAFGLTVQKPFRLKAQRPSST